MLSVAKAVCKTRTKAEVDDRELKELITAMNDFSEKLMQNDVSNLPTSLQTVSKKLEAFRNKSSYENFKAKLFSMLADQLWEKMPHNENIFLLNLQLAEWCEQCNLPMQALTFGQEVLPRTLLWYTRLNFKPEYAQEIWTRLNAYDNGVGKKLWHLGIVQELAFRSQQLSGAEHDEEYYELVRSKLDKCVTSLESTEPLFDVLVAYQKIWLLRNAVLHSNATGRIPQYDEMMEDIRVYHEAFAKLLEQPVNLSSCFEHLDTGYFFKEYIDNIRH